MRKSSAMFFRPDSTQVKSVSITYNNIVLPTVTSTKLLGVSIDHQLTWEEHVKQMSCKVGRKIGAFLRSRRFLSPQARRLYLQSVIIPDFDYCSPVFATSLSHSNMHRLQVLERRAVRACFGACTVEASEPLYVELNIAPLQDRWLWKLLLMTFQAVKGLRPPSVNSIFCRTSHSYTTRGSLNDSVRPRRAIRKVGRTSFSFRASILWNALPSSCCNSRSLSEFTSALSVLDQSDVGKLRELAFGQLPS